MELYKKYRPKDFDQIIGNSYIVSSMESLLAEKNFPHAILLSGPSGCGKTTIARILKDKLNCSDNCFQEENLANNNGVDFARDIVSKIRLKPLSGDCRIWLLDECHQMSIACANVLLKPLEDTPEHVYFILSTSEPEKLIPALKTRLTHFQFSSLNEMQLTELLTRVAKKEKIKIEESNLETIAENSNGSARMALVLLDKVRNLESDLVEKAIEDFSAQVNESIELARALIYGKPWNQILEILKGIKDDPEKVRRSILGYATAVLSNPKTNKPMQIKSYNVIQIFANSFFNSGKAGLVASCFEATHDEE